MHLEEKKSNDPCYFFWNNYDLEWMRYNLIHSLTCKQPLKVGVNFINVLHTNVVLAAFSSYVLALSKNSYKKHARFSLMKLTAGVKPTKFISLYWVKYISHH